MRPLWAPIYTGNTFSIPQPSKGFNTQHSRKETKLVWAARWWKSPASTFIPLLFPQMQDPAITRWVPCRTCSYCHVLIFRRDEPAAFTIVPGNTTVLESQNLPWGLDTALHWNTTYFPSAFEGRNSSILLPFSEAEKRMSSSFQLRNILLHWDKLSGGNIFFFKLEVMQT